MNKISIIVPIYNAEKCLKRCIDSILNQTYKNLEIILVNDGSTDSSAQIIEDYARKDQRIKIINKSNGGQSSARNEGIEYATGKYIAFVDSDDWIVEDIYEHCLSIGMENDSDVVDFRVIFSYKEDEAFTMKEKGAFNTSILEGEEILRDYLLRGQTEKAPFSPCRKLYKAELFNGIRFPEGKINEDIVTNFLILSKAKKVIISSKIGYFYNQYGNSTTRNGLKSKDFDLLEASEELLRLTREIGNLELIYLAEVKKARSYFSLLAKIAYYGIDENKLDEKDIVDYLTKELRKKYFLLIKSPMQFNRKILASLLAVNIKILSIPLKIYRKIK